MNSTQYRPVYIGKTILFVALNRKIRLAQIVDSFTENNEKMFISHGTTTDILTVNRGTAPAPLYHVEEWAHEARIKAFYGVDPDLLNDDRCARMLSAIAPHSQIIYTAVAITLLNKFNRLLKSRKKTEKISTVQQREETSHHIIFNLDSTNISFAGAYDESDFVREGYSNDHTINKKQIRLQLLTLRNRVPIFHEAAPGNSVDKNALGDVITHFLGILDVVEDDTPLLNPEKMSLVIDRGYTTPKNLFLLDDKGLHFIGMASDTTTIKDAIVSVSEKEFKNCTWVHKKGTVYRTAESEVQLKYNGRRKGFRIVVVWSSDKEERDKKAIREQIQKLDRKLQEIKVKLNRYNYKSVKYVKKQVSQVLNSVSMKYRGLVVVSVTGEDGHVELEWHVSKEKVEELERRAGKYVLITNWRKEEISGCEALKEYKSRNGGIEWVFRGLKRDINVRPIYLRDEERIGALVMITMVAMLEFVYIYNMLWDAPRRGAFWRWLNFRFYSAGFVQIIEGGQVAKEVPGVLDEEQREIFRRLGLEPPPPFE